MMADFHSMVFIPKISTFIPPNALGYLSFYGNTDFTKNVRFLEIFHNFRQMIRDKMS